MIACLALTAFILALASPAEGASTAREAKSLYAAGRYAEAAAIFDALYTEEREAKYLFNAAAAHEAAGHDVAALVAYQHYLHVEGLLAVDRPEVDARIGQLQARLVPVALTIEPAGLRQHATVVARRSEDGANLVMDLEWFDVDDGGSRAAESERPIFLSPGAWSLRLELRGPTGELYEAAREALVYVPLPGEDAAAAVAVLMARPVQSAVTLRLGPEAALTRGVDIRFEDPLGIEPPIVMTAKQGEVKVVLRSGPWRYSLKPRRRRAEASSGEVEVARGGEDVMERLDLVADGEGGVGGSGRGGADRRERWVLGGALGGAGVLLAAGGAVMLRVGERGIKKARYDILLPDDSMYTGYHYKAEDAVGWSAGGAGLLGGGLGLGVSALTAGLRAPRKVWWGELGFGSAATIAGVAWHASAFSRYSGQSVGVPPGAEGSLSRKSVEKYHGEILGSAAILGLGVTVAAGAVVGLFLPDWTHKKLAMNARALVGRGLTGVVLTRAF